MNISWLDFDQHNAKSGESVIAKVQPVNEQPVCILYNVGNNNIFRNAALETAGFKYSRQGVWVCPVHLIDLAALRAAFPLLQFEDVNAPVKDVIEEPKNSPNSFLSVMYRNSFEEEYAPNLTVNRYEGGLPPAGENIKYWLEENGKRISSNTFEARYTEGTNVTITFDKNRYVSALFHKPEFHSELNELYLEERQAIDSTIGSPFAFNGKVFIQLANETFAPAINYPTGPLALTSFACPSPQEVLRRTDIETLNKVMTESEWIAFQESQIGTTEPSEANESEPSEANASEPSEANTTEQSEDNAANDPGEFKPELLLKICADTIDQLRAQDVDRLINASADVSEDALFTMYGYINEHRADLSDQVHDAIDDIAGFYTNSNIKELADLANERMEIAYRDAAAIELIETSNGSIEGKELAHSSLKQWAFITPDLNDPDNLIRYTVFDENGYKDHRVFNSEDEAFSSLVKQEGFTEWDLGVFNQLKHTAPFKQWQLDDKKTYIDPTEPEVTKSSEATLESHIQLTPEQSTQKILNAFNARSFLSKYSLQHEFISQEKDGDFTSIHFKGSDSICHIEGRVSKSTVMKALNAVCKENAQQLINAYVDGHLEKLDLPEGHNASVNSKKAINLVEQVGDYKFSVHIAPDPATNLSDKDKFYAELRIFLNDNKPRAILFMESGEKIDILSQEERDLTFPVALTFEDLYEKLAETVKYIVGKFVTGAYHKPAPKPEEKEKPTEAPTISEATASTNPDHWAADYVNAETQSKVDALEASAHNHNHTVEWYTFHRENTGTVLIGRLTEGKYDVIFNDEGTIQQSRSLLDLYRKTQRATFIRTTADSDNSPKEAIMAPAKHEPRKAGSKGEYGLDDNWYSPDQEMPASALVAPPENAELDQPDNQQSIYGKIRNFVQPLENDGSKLEKRDIPTPDLLNYFNSVEQFNALLDRYNSGKRFYSPEWLMLNFSAVAETPEELLQAPKGSIFVNQATNINFSAVVRDHNHAPYMVLSKRGNKMQIAKFVDDKPVVHSDCPTVTINSGNYYFNDEWCEDNNQIIQHTSKPEDSNVESNDSETAFYLNDGLSSLLVQIDKWIETGNGKTLDSAAKSLSVAKRKKDETNDTRSERLLSIASLIKEIANINPETFSSENKLPRIKEILQTLGLSTTGNKKALVDKIYNHLESLGANFVTLKEKRSLLIELSKKLKKGEAISIDEITAAKGVESLKNAMAYTAGDVQVAVALDESTVRPKGQRNNNEHYYNKMEQFLDDPLGFLHQHGLIESDHFKSYVEARRSILNIESLVYLLPPYLRPLLKTIGLPENINLDSIIYELDAALIQAPSIDISYKQAEESVPEYKQPEITDGSNYVLSDSFKYTSERWAHIKKGETELFPYEVELLELINDAKNAGINSFTGAKEFILDKHPEFFPSDIDNGAASGAIQTEITFAWQYLRQYLEQKQKQDAHTEDKLPESPAISSKIVSLKAESQPGELAKKDIGMPTEMVDFLDRLSQADVHLKDLSHYVYLSALVDESAKADSNVASFQNIKAKKALDKYFNELSGKALSVGLALDHSALNNLAEEMKTVMKEIEDNKTTPWLLPTTVIKSFDNEEFISTSDSIKNDNELALYTAKRLGLEAEIRLIENHLNGEQTISPDLINGLKDKFQNFARIFELDQEIDNLLQGASEEVLSSYQYQNLKELKRERAELMYHPSQIDITPELVTIYRSNTSYSETNDAISQELGIDYEAAEILSERISDELRLANIKEEQSKPEFKLGLEVLSKLERFVRANEDDVSSIGYRYVGPYKVDLNTPEIKDGWYEISIFVTSADRVTNPTDFERFSVDENHNSPAEDLAKQIQDYVSTKETVVQTDRLPEYGSKLNSGENGSPIYGLTEINKRIRQDIKDLKDTGVLPKELKVSITKAHSSISITVKNVPESIPVINPEFALWKLENPQGSYFDAPHSYTDEYRALIIGLESIAYAYNYDHSDSQTDYFNTNFYLNIKTDYDLEDSETAKALNVCKSNTTKTEANDAEVIAEGQIEDVEANDAEVIAEGQIEDVEANDAEVIAESQIESEIVTKPKLRKRIYALPYEAEFNKASDELLDMSQDVRDYEGKKTGWKAIEVSQDELGLRAGGGTLLINPNTHELMPFLADGISSNAAYLSAASYAISNPPSTNQPSPTSETSSLIRIKPPKKQQGEAAKNISTLLATLGYEQLDFAQEDYHLTVENEPYKDLVIELHPSMINESNRTLFLTHYIRENGDSYIDAELVFEITHEGDLYVSQTATQNPINGGELRGKDISFATLFSKNLLSQDFTQGRVIDHNKAKQSSTVLDVDLTKAPIDEFKEHLSSIEANDNDENRTEYTMLLAYRYGQGESLDRAQEIDVRISEGTATNSDLAIFKNLQNVFQKAYENELNKEQEDEHNNTRISSNQSNIGNATPAGKTETNSKQIIGHLSNNQRVDDREETRTISTGLPGDESSAPQQQLHGASRVSSLDTDVQGRNADSVNQRGDAYTNNRQLDNYPREDIISFENGGANDIRAAFSRAVNLYLQLKTEDRLPTPEEMRQLSAFGGTGMSVITKHLSSPHYSGNYEYELHKSLHALHTQHPEAYKSLKASTVDSYYTPSTIIDFMWAALDRMGSGQVDHPLHILEPSIGNGRFIGLAPERIRETAVITGIEKDTFSSELTAMAYPEANIINEGFEDVILPTKSQDIIIGNPPYGDISVYDAQDKRQRLIHDYFLKRSVELAKPGGIIAFVTSSGTMDKANSTIRQTIAKSAELISAFRLPNSVFSKADANVVTDILFFQRLQPNQSPTNANWLETGVIELEDSQSETGVSEGQINQYFIDNPDNILGQLEWGTGRFGKKLQVSGLLNSEKLNALLNQLPENILNTKKHHSHHDANLEDITSNPAFSHLKVGSYFNENDRIFILNKNGKVPFSSKGKKQNKIIKLIEIRDTVLSLIDSEQEANFDTAEKNRNLLNKLYDNFVSDFGALNSKSNKNLLSLDPDQFLVLALEIESNGTYQKADIFHKPIIDLNEHTPNINSTSDAVLYLLNTKGIINEFDVAELLDIDSQSAIEGITDLCFRNPNNGLWELKALYLSGNIYEKLEEAEKASRHNPAYSRNVEALKKEIPNLISISDINIRMGVSWITDDIIEKFIFNKYSASTFEDRIQVNFEPHTHSWDVRLTPAARRDFREINEGEEAEGGLRFDQILTHTLNQKRPRIKDKNGDFDPEKTALVKAKQDALIEEFKNFVLANPKYSEIVEKSYNRQFNGYKEAIFDGSYMTFPGMSNSINGKPLKLRPHQPAIVERILHSDSGVLIAHEAGAGKTIEQISSALEMKRLGQAKAPLLVIPNHMLDQATREARDLYPKGKILTATAQDFSSDGRALFANKVKMNEWDLVICTHSMFSSMAIPASFATDHIQEEIESFEILIKEQSDNKISLRNLEKAKKKLEAKLKTTMKQLEESKDDICFGECGFDALFYDEGHYLKNYAPPTTLSSVAGVNNTTSARSFDAVMKADYIRSKRQDNKGVYLSTATPITNSVSEIWVMLRLVCPKLLKESGLYSFDNFAATFCEVVDHIELRPEGGSYQLKSRLSRFHNVPELIRIFRMAADIKTADDLNLPTPKANELRHVAPQSKEMNLFMDWLSYRAGLVRKAAVTPDKDNILSIANDGRTASLDLRLFHEDLPDHPDSKVNQCVKRVYDKYIEHSEDRRTQLVFCDRGTPKAGFNIYSDMKSKWINLGIPESEIAFIHDAKNDEQKADLFSKVRAGTVRILIGSTDKMGVGTNVQTRGSDLHMLDIPWRPTDLIQRRKRFERQGNIFDDVNIHFYTTEDSFDLFMLETVVRKLKFITQALSSPEKAARRLDEDVDPSLSEIMAITTGNPLIKDKVEVDSKVDQLQLFKRAHMSRCNQSLQEASWLESHLLPRYQENLDSHKKAYEILPESFEMTVDGRTYTEPKKAGIALHQIMKSTIGAGKEIATIAGFPVVTAVTQERYYLTWNGPLKTEVTVTKDPERFTNNFFKSFAQIPHQIKTLENRIEKETIAMKNHLENSTKPFASEAELQELLIKKSEIDMEVAKLAPPDTHINTDGFVHEFEAIIGELNAKQCLLSEDEISVYQNHVAGNAASSNSTPRI